MEERNDFMKVCSSEDTLGLIQKSKKAAEEHQVLYHCTNTEAFKNIIRTREFWLRNLKLVNDKEEAEKIILPEFKHNFYVGSFTYKNNVSTDHWKEYASLSDGVLFSVSQGWFYRNAIPMDEENNKIDILVYKTGREGHAAFWEEAKTQRTSDIYVYCLEDFSFYQIIYSDSKETHIIQDAYAKLSDGDDEGLPTSLVIPNISGVIKKKSGMCKRDNQQEYMKNWQEENEVRLKLRIQRVMTETGIIPPSDDGFCKAAVQLNEKAFEETSIRFSPEYPLEKKEQTLTEIQKIAPYMKVSVIE